MSAEESMDTNAKTEGEDIDTSINKLADMVKDTLDEKSEQQEENDEDKGEGKDGDETKDEMETEATPDTKKKKAKKAIDKTERPPLVRALKGTVVIRKFKMKDSKMKDFIGILSKAESFNFEYADNEGTITLNYSPYKDYKALSIIQLLNNLQEFDSEIEIDTTDEIKNEIEAEKYGIRRQFASQVKDKMLYVNNITNDTTCELLRALVPDCSRAIIPEDETGQRKGWAVLEFISCKSADDTMKNIRNIELGTDNKVAITRSESSDPAQVEKAREEFKNKPAKKVQKEKQDQKKKAPVGNNKPGGKRKWNQGPGGPGFGGGRQNTMPLMNQRGMMGRQMGGGLLDRPMSGPMGHRSGGMGARFSVGDQLARQNMDQGWAGGDRPSSMFGGNQNRMVQFLENALDEIKSSKGGSMQGGYGYEDEGYGYGNNDYQSYGNNNYGGGYQGPQKQQRMLGGNMNNNNMRSGGFRNQGGMQNYGKGNQRQGINIWEQGNRGSGGYY